MSGPHPTISAWTREEREGYFEAELHDWKLRVNWTPRAKDSTGGFSWIAERDDQKVESDERYEEPELAMAAAEHVAKVDADQRTAEVADDKDDGDED